MVRFSTEEDNGFIALCGELRRWIRELDGPKHTSPAGVNGGETEDNLMDVKCKHKHEDISRRQD